MANAGRVAIVPKGDYSSSTAYNRLDLVRYNEKAYVAKKANTGILPTNTEYWMLMTSDGITIDTALSDTSTNPVQNKVVKNALDNIQTTSKATLSTAGWYRVAEYERAIDYAYYDVAFKLVTVYSSIGSINGTFIASCQRKNIILKALETVTAGTHLITKLRVTYDGTKHYLEVYYSVDTEKANSCTFTVLDSVTNTKDQNWKAIDFIPTSETVDGVTVTTTYDIPANASPVTDLDLEDYYGLLPPTKSIPSGADLNTYTTVGVYSIATASVANSLLNKPTALTHGGKLVVENTQNDTNFYQTIYSSDGVFRRYISGNTFNEWKTLATTADLANYLPKTGGDINGNVVVNGKVFATVNEGESYFRVQNSNGTLDLIVSTDGSRGLFDRTGGGWFARIKSDGTKEFNGTASGNLPLNGGGTVVGTNNMPIRLRSKASNNVYQGFETYSGSFVGALGFNVNGKPSFLNSAQSVESELLHTGNSAKVVVSETAPTDTNTVWFDTTNKKTKVYIDGAWTVIA